MADKEIYVGDFNNKRVQVFKDGCNNNLNNYILSNTYTSAYPTGIDVDNGGNILVGGAWENYHVVKKYNSSFIQTSTISCKQSPLGVSTDPTGNIFVANQNNIEKHLINGTSISSTRLASVGYVATDLQGFIYGASPHGTIYKLDNNLTVIGEYFTRRPEDTESYLGRIALDNEGSIYVAEVGNNPAIKKYDKNFNYLFSWKSQVVGKPFNDIKEITVDNNGNVYVTDITNTQVLKYNNNGLLLAIIILPNNSAFEPIGIDIDNDCNIWVSDKSAQRVYKFIPTAGSNIRQGTFIIENNEIALSITPNPSIDHFTINFPEIGTHEIVMYNTKGVEVLRKTVEGKELNIAVPSLPGGLYTIHETCNNVTNKAKVIIAE